MAYGNNYNQELDDEKMSRINAAGIINITLENLWRDCSSSMSSGHLSKWNLKLDAIWVILGGDVKEGDVDDDKMKQIDINIYNTGSLNHKKVGFQVPTETDNGKMSLQYVLLKNKALFLRRLQNSQGKGTAYVNSDYDDFD